MKQFPNRQTGFGGMSVLALESRRAREMAQLIAHYGGRPVMAPAMREVPLKDNTGVRDFVSALLEGQFASVIFLTGVGTRALAQAAADICSPQQFVEALSRTAVVARGPKPVAALRELTVPIAATVPEPNTWRELLAVLDERRDSIPLRGRSVAVQEYGAPNPELISGLKDRGATVFTVKTYEWSLPQDTAPLEAAVRSLVGGEISIVLVTSSAQVSHLLEIAEALHLRENLVRAFSSIVVGSIGPVASAQLRNEGIAVDLEPVHPKMGWLVKEAAERCSQLLEIKTTRLGSG